MFSSILLSTLIPTAVLAANDWKTPCLNGVCAYESGDGVNSAYSKLQLNGSPDSISDITSAAGWTISNCDANSTEGQSITLACDPKGPNADKCSHVSSGTPVNKIIRLPEACGKGPYARIVSWDSPQTNKTKRAGDPVTHLCTFDYNFDKIPSNSKPIEFTIYGTSTPGVMDKINPIVQRDFFDNAHRSYPRRVLAPRGLFDKIKDGIKNAASDVADTAKDAGKAVADTAKDAGKAAADTAKDAAAAAKDVTTFDESKKDQKLAPIDVNKSFNLFHATVSCATGTGSIDVSVDTKFHADITTGFALKGSVVPPKLDEFGLYAQMNSKVDATVHVLGTADGFFDSGKRPIFPPLGLPGLSIPGIVTLGPQASINGQVTGTLNANVNLTMGVSKSFNDVNLTFPPSKGKSSAKVVDNKAPFGLNLGASGDAVGDVAVHIIPRIDFGLDVLKGLGKATVFLELDASADMSGTVSATVAASNAKAPAAKPAVSSKAATPKATPKAAMAVEAVKEPTEGKAEPVAEDEAALEAASVEDEAVIQDEAEATMERRAATKITSGTANGCVTLDIAVDVRAGAVGAIQPFFNKQTTVDLFKKSKQVFNKCFDKSKTPTKRSMYARVPSRSARRSVMAKQKRALTCAKTAGLNSISTVVNQLLL